MKNLVKIIFAQVVITMLALCLLWQNAKLQQGGYIEQQINAHIEDTSSHLQLLRAEVAALSSPQRITQLVEELNLPIQQQNAIPSQTVAIAAPGHCHQKSINLNSGNTRIENAR